MEGGVGRGHAAVDRALQQQFLNFFASYFVIQRGSDVHPKFIVAIEGDHHRERYEAARIPRESRPRPDFTPGVTRDEVLKRFGERGFIFLRFIDVRVAEHLAPNLHSRLVPFAVIHIAPTI